jgi:hypothetical protein
MAATERATASRAGGPQLAWPRLGASHGGDVGLPFSHVSDSDDGGGGRGWEGGVPEGERWDG